MHHAVRTLRNHFVPHEDNAYTPHVLHHRALFGYSVLLVMLKVLLLVVSVAFPAALVFSSAITASNIVALTNANRDASGLPELRENSQLSAAAIAKAEDMMLNEYFAHTSPSGKTPWDFIRGAGYAYTLAGENLAVHYQTAEDVTAGWLASPSHRANIMNERFSEIGVGVVMGEYQGFESIMVVQMFGEPVVAAEEPVQTPPTEEIVVPEPEPAPIEAPEPAPTAPEPVPEEPVAVLGETVTAPVIDIDTVSVLPAEGGYAVTLAVEHADDVRVQVGTNTAELAVVPAEEVAPDAPQVWTTTLPVDVEEVAAGGELMYVTATNEDDEETIEPVAVVAPRASTPELWAFTAAPKPDVRLFGLIPVLHLDQTVGQIYFFTIVFLAVCLLISVLAKFEHHRHSVTAHTLVVILLAGLLAVL